MSYSEENGQVVLRMSKEDYAHLLILLGGAFVSLYANGVGNFAEDLAFCNRLNHGNPNYQTYNVSK